MASTLSNGNDRLRNGNRRRHRGFMVSCDRKSRFSMDGRCATNKCVWWWNFIHKLKERVVRVWSFFGGSREVLSMSFPMQQQLHPRSLVQNCFLFASFFVKILFLWSVIRSCALFFCELGLLNHGSGIFMSQCLSVHLHLMTLCHLTVKQTNARSVIMKTEDQHPPIINKQQVELLFQPLFKNNVW